MKSEDRAIGYAFDNETLTVIDLDDFIRSQKEGFELRSHYNNNLSRFTCVECGQKLIASHSRKDKVYFRHLPYSDNCILKESKYGDLLNSYSQVAFARESPRHKELKLKIGEYLKIVDGVDIESVNVDSTFIHDKIKGEKRRPDVYCEFRGKKLAFEIQLSYLPLHYITHRCKFYRENDIYLIWILDFQNKPNELATFQRDIKYIWKHQNLFMLDETQDVNLFFDCHFKQPFIFQNSSIHEKWLNKNIALENLVFSEDDYSCYYLHYDNEHFSITKDLGIIQERKEQKRKDDEKKAKREWVKEKVNALIQKISKFRELDYNFYSLAQQINSLDDDCVHELNRTVNLDRKTVDGVPLFLHYISEYKNLNGYGGMNIAEFLLSCYNFNFDILSRDKDGKGIIQHLYNNPSLESYLYKKKIPVFNRGYKLNEFDKDFLLDKDPKEGLKLYLEFSYYAACDSPAEREIVKGILSFLWFVESAKKMKIIGSNVRSWVQYLVIVMSRHRSLWTYMREVLIKTDLGQEIKRVDAKGTIKRKIKEFDLQESPHDIELYSVLVKTYPEIFM